jgi:ATP-dependent DNA helicase RecG
MSLPINLSDLLHGRTIEWERLEFKQGWNPEEVVHSLCAFANDLHNWGGGYIILGVADKDGQPVLPPAGLQQNQLDAIQGEIIKLGNRISPTYFPITQPYLVAEKLILVLWCPAGDNRPYRAPETLGKQAPYHEYIRVGSRSIRATGEPLRQLYELAARIPFDDRINNRATLQDLDLGLIQAYLQELKSDLYEESKSMPFAELCRAMHIAKGADEDIRPVNVGLLFFNRAPENFISRSWIEVVWHQHGAFTEHYFKGPLQHHLRDALSFIRTNIIAEKVVKHPDKAEADRFFNFPYPAIEEVLANAVYHKSYELDSPIEVQIWDDKVEILSYPAAIPPVNKEVLTTSRRIISRQYRNRRIGDFLKELKLTEGRATGFPTIYDAMAKNGSPAPIFDTDDSTYFLVTLPVHEAYSNQAGDLVSDLALSQSISTLSDLISYCAQESDRAGDRAGDRAKEIIEKEIHPKVSDILSYIEKWKSREEILNHIGLTLRSKHKVKYIDPLLEIGWIEMKFPDSQTHPEQRYKLSESGRRLLELINTKTAK